jgi:mannose-6-phosphate isomerase-like protein (cupin superfamily)
MSSRILAPPLSGNVIGTASDSFVVAGWGDPGGPAGSRRLIAPFHVHRSDEEAWYVLEGALYVKADKEEIEVRAGAAAFVARGTPHTYWNPGPGPVRYLLVMTVNIFRLIQAIHAASDRSPAALGALFRKHDSELLDE